MQKKFIPIIVSGGLLLFLVAHLSGWYRSQLNPQPTPQPTPSSKLPQTKRVEQKNSERSIRGGPTGLTSDVEKLRQKSEVENFVTANIDQMSTEQLLLTMHSYLDNNNIICGRKLRMGTVGDGGWEICDDQDVRPRSPCIIYSFGINYEFSFDDDAARVYRCDVYSFDPSMSQMETSNRSARVHFYKLGLGGKTERNKKGWQLYTFSDILAMLGHRNATIDVVKMDIESSEWSSISEMVASGQLTSVRQFLVEYHVTSTDRKYLLARLKTIQMMERAGFKKFYVHKNPACLFALPSFPVLRSMCYEIHYMKRS